MLAENPCRDCEHASSCKLPLSCAHYLRYQQALRQCRADAAALRQVKLRNTDEWLLPSLNQRRRKLAEACPWVREEGAPVGKKIDYEQVQKLYNAGLNDPAIAEQLGIAEMSVYQWRKRNLLPPRGRRKPPALPEARAKPETAPPAAPSPERGSGGILSETGISGETGVPGETGVLERVRQLMALVRPEDTQTARSLAAQLAGQWILDSFSDACTQTGNKSSAAPPK